MTAGFGPATASVVWNSPIYMTGSAKYTSTLTNRLLHAPSAALRDAAQSGDATLAEAAARLFRAGRDPQ